MTTLSELLLHLARGLVREPERVSVRERAARGRAVLELAVAPGDRGRVIGRDGRTANALRALVEALARHRGDSVELEVLD